MKSQHLSDEAVAAFADGVLRGHAHDRASRHTAECPECAHAVAVQREAVWALRAAPAPALPTGLLDRLRDVPSSTPLRLPPTTIGPDGSTLLATFGSMSGAALVPPDTTRPADRASFVRRRLAPIAGTAAAVAVAGVIAVGSAAHASGPVAPQQPLRQAPAGIVAPASVHDTTGR